MKSVRQNLNVVLKMVKINVGVLIIQILYQSNQINVYVKTHALVLTSVFVRKESDT